MLKDLEKASEDAPLPLTPQEKQVVQECDQPDKGEEARYSSLPLPWLLSFQ